MDPLALTALVAVVAAVIGGAVVRSRRAAPSLPRIDPFTVGEPWRRYVQDAMSARARLRGVVDATAPGPLHERLVDVARRLDAGVAECWTAARRGHALDTARRSIDVAAVERRLAALEAPAPDDAAVAGGEPAAPLDDMGPALGDDPRTATIDALRAQRDAAARMDATSSQVRSQLQLLTARMQEIVARMLELAASPSPTAPDELAQLGRAVDPVVVEMEALRQALEETSRLAWPGGPGTA